MKSYIKKLLRESLLGEMEIGNTLFGKAPRGRGLGKGDPPQWEWSDSRRDDHSLVGKIKQSMGKYVDETNTDEEHKFLRFINAWLNIGSDSTTWAEMPSSIFSDFKFLLGVKNKYPLMLDPKKSNTPKEYMYRGTNIPKALAMEIVKNGPISDTNTRTIEGWDSDGKKGAISYHFISAALSIKSRALEKKKAVSFSSQFDTAAYFLLDYSRKHKLAWGDRVPCILEVPTSSPSLLFNPDFLDLITGFKEGETLYVSDSDVKISGIWLPSEIINK